MVRFSDSLYVGWLLRWLEEQDPSFRKLLNEIEISIPQDNRGYRASVMPVAKYLKLINCLAELLKDEYIGLRLGMDMDLRDYGYAGELLHYCSSLRECCIGFEKYCKTMSPQMRACFNEGKRTSFLEYEIMGFDSDYCRHDTDLSLVATMRFFQTYIGDGWQPSLVQLKRSHPLDPARYSAIYGENVCFNQPRNAIHFQTEVLDTTVSDTDPYLLAVLQKHINELLDQIAARDQLVERVRYSIACTIGTDSCTAREISQRLCISQRTMNRTLRCFGTSFRAMKAAVMEEIAKAALAESSTSVTAIALQLGYSEVAAFNHAFKKKTGLSPSAYRTLSTHP